jgi:hypothetical protein
MPRVAKIREIASPIRNGNGVGKVRLLSRQVLDGRTVAARQFDHIAASISQDLGGADRLSTIQKHLVEAFAGCAVHVHDLNARMLLGEKVDLAEHAQAVTTLVRVASRLPIGRVAKQIPSMAEYLRSLPHEEPQHADEVELADD